MAETPCDQCRHSVERYRTLLGGYPSFSPHLACLRSASIVPDRVKAGETTIIGKVRWCDDERWPSFIARLFRLSRCGPEGRFFERRGK